MSKSPVITSILTKPGLATTGEGLGSILVGVVIDDSEIAWGACEDIPVENPPEGQPPFGIDRGIATIEEIVVPSLVGEKVNYFRSLASEIESLRETVTISRVIEQPEARSPGVSRRAVITGFMASEPKSPPVVENFTVEGPIHPAIRHGISQALLSAVARVRRLMPAEIIIEEFDLPLPSKSIALQMPIRRGQSLIIYDQVSALAYTVDETDPESSLGLNSKRIQHFVRQLKERLVGANQQCPITIHLNGKGSLGKLYDDNLGKILGGLYGLEQAAFPCPMRVQDPLIMEDIGGQIEAFSQLRDYLRIRKMSCQLTAGARIHSLEVVQRFVETGAAHMLLLAMPRIGTIQELVLAIQACRSGGIGILLEGTRSALTAQVALATQPDVLTYPPDRTGDASVTTFHNEMARTLAGLATRDSKE